MLEVVLELACVDVTVAVGVLALAVAQLSQWLLTPLAYSPS